MSFEYNGIHFETEMSWIEGNNIILYANGKPYRRKVYFNRTDGLYIVFNNTRLYYSDFK